MMVSIKEYAEHCGVHYNTIYRMIQDGKLPAMKVRSRYRIDIKKADAFLDVQEENQIKHDRRTAGQNVIFIDEKNIKKVAKDSVRRMCDEIKNGTYGRGYSVPWLANSR